MSRFNNELLNFTSLPRELIFDKSLSDRARFIYCFMACKPNDWDFYLEPMANELGYSVDTLRKYITELVKSGWLEKGEQEREKGVFKATSYTLKSTKKTDTEKNRHGENPTQHNIDYIDKQDIENKEKEDKSSSKKGARKKQNSNSEWRKDFNLYKQLVLSAKEELLNDEQAKYNLLYMYPNADYYRTVLKSSEFWISEKGWEYKKKGTSKDVNMVQTLKNNLNKSIVYKNVNDQPIENLQKLNISVNEQGICADGTFIRGAYRYYHSMRDNKDYSIPIQALPMPNERCEFNMKTQSWYLPYENENTDDLLW